MGLFSKLRWFTRGPRHSRITASIRPKAPELGELLRRPKFVHGILLIIICASLITLAIDWGRMHSRIWPGEIADSSLVNLDKFTETDDLETNRLREEARRNAVRYYLPNSALLQNLGAAIKGLPVAVREQTTPESIDESLRSQFDIDANSLEVLQRYSDSEGATPRWKDSTDTFIRLLWSMEPLLDPSEFQIFATTLERKVIPINKTSADVAEATKVSRAIALEPDLVNDPENLIELARRAGFRTDAQKIVIAPLLKELSPTVIYDPVASSAAQEKAAAEVGEAEITHERGEVVYSKGDVITSEQVTLADQTLANMHEYGSAGARRFRVFGWSLLALVLTILLAGHGIIFYSSIARSTARLTALLSILVCSTAVAVIFAVEFPRLHVFGATFAVATLSTILTLAYDRRIAIFASVISAMAICVATGEPMAFIIALVAVGAALALQLGEIAHRGAFIRASVISAALALTVFAAEGLANTPLSIAGATRQIFGDAVLAAAATLGAGFFMLGIMPSLERTFDITTGLTLAELRDPRQPLLRQLQARAPGTYNHSLAVATIAEHAAEAIGADSRLVYVGGLYHDIGKINKPEYFIENQGGRENKHAKLSPAMSLLVIVGHVKDGLELAKEYAIPKVLRHFIASHHGTTLVEYFFHAAREQAATEGSEVEEFEYRYPGPKPQTRETAILLLCDGIESAARTMTDPTPSSIEALVRRMSRRRLDDGQLNESPLSFNELRIIEDSIIKSLCAIYHSRIAYPAQEEDTTDTVVEPRIANS